jgi:lipid-A-disaccharide synthase
MESAGLHRIVRAEDVAHMGITEVIRHMPSVYANYRRLVASIKKQRPAAAILIDFPDVNFRLARGLKKLNIPVIYFVSPQLWAWKRSRLRWVQQRVGRMLVIFPFEQPFYRNRNVNAEFVGHPLAELPLPTISREAYAATHNLDPTRQWIALLPGSRSKEVKANLPELLRTADLLTSSNDTACASTEEPVLSTVKESADTLASRYPKAGSPGLQPWVSLGLSPRRENGALAPGVCPPPPGQQLQSSARSNVSSNAKASFELLIPVASTLSPEFVQTIVSDSSYQSVNIHLVPDAREALHHARASIVASGTATVQAAVIGNPFVVVYKVSPLTFRLAKRLIHYPPEIWPNNQPDADGNLPIAMVNLIAGRRIVPELIQQNFTAEKVAAAIRPLLADTPERNQMIADLAEVRKALQPASETTPKTTAIHKVCDAVESLLPHTPRPRSKSNN